MELQTGIGKGVCQGYMLSPSLYNLYAEYIMWNAGLDESQAGIKTVGRDTNNLRYADNQLLKNQTAVQETPVWFLGQEDALEKR